LELLQGLAAALLLLEELELAFALGLDLLGGGRGVGGWVG
jgi:hypothetical protein